MSIIAVQQCRSLDGWIPVQIASHSNPGEAYIVFVNAWAPVEQVICSCPGWKFRHYCKHQREAVLALCRWEENAVSEPQNPEQKERMICPRCLGATKFDVKVINEDS